MKREEAVSLIKEITEEKYTNIVGHDIILMLPKPDDELSEGFKLHIKTTLDKGSLRCLELIVQQNDYVLRNDPDKGAIEIFKPKGARIYEESGRM